MLRIVRLREADGGGHARQVARHQHHVGALDGDVGAGADGDADIGRGKRRRVVDAVADEGDAAAGPCRRVTASTLPSGSTSATTSSMPSVRGDRLRRAAVVAGDHRDLQPHGVQRRDGGGRRRLHRIGHRDDGGEPAVDGGIERRLALAAEALGGGGEGRDVEAELRHVAVGAHGDLMALDACRARRSRGWPRSPRRRERRGPSPAPRRRWRRRSDVRTALSTAATSASASSARQPSATSKSVSSGRPSVSVPVLSSATTCTSRRLCSASPLRNSTPSSAARPVPTMIEVGVASPMAQGQAMISTATALTSAEGERGLRPEDEPDEEGQRRHRHHRRHEPRGDAVDQRLDRQLGALRLLHHADDLGQQRVGADLGGAIGEAAGLVDGAADDLGALAPWKRERARR